MLCSSNCDRKNIARLIKERQKEIRQIEDSDMRQDEKEKSLMRVYRVIVELIMEYLLIVESKLTEYEAEAEYNSRKYQEDLERFSNH